MTPITMPMIIESMSVWKDIWGCNILSKSYYDTRFAETYFCLDTKVSKTSSLGRSGKISISTYSFP